MASGALRMAPSTRFEDEEHPGITDHDDPYFNTNSTLVLT
jgi:hypothetical protein